jgi:hypothetical protein
MAVRVLLLLLVVVVVVVLVVIDVDVTDWRTLVLINGLTGRWMMVGGAGRNTLEHTTTTTNTFFFSLTLTHPYTHRFSSLFDDHVSFLVIILSPVFSTCCLDHTGRPNKRGTKTKTYTDRPTDQQVLPWPRRWGCSYKKITVTRGF